MRFRTHVVLSLLALGLFPLASCDTSMEPTSKPVVNATLNQPFTLEPGQTARFANEQLSLTFAGVLGDGRCPTDAFCLVAGTATTTVYAKQDDRAAMNLSVTLPTVPEGVAYESFRLHATTLFPLPISTRTISPGEYRLTLVVDRP